MMGLEQGSNTTYLRVFGTTEPTFWNFMDWLLRTKQAPPVDPLGRYGDIIYATRPAPIANKVLTANTGFFSAPVVEQQQAPSASTGIRLMNTKRLFPGGVALLSGLTEYMSRRVRSCSDAAEPSLFSYATSPSFDAIWSPFDGVVRLDIDLSLANGFGDGGNNEIGSISSGLFSGPMDSLGNDRDVDRGLVPRPSSALANLWSSTHIDVSASLALSIVIELPPTGSTIVDAVASLDPFITIRSASIVGKKHRLVFV